MGLHVITGPLWEEDSLNHINEEAVEINLKQRMKEEGLEIETFEEIMMSNPLVMDIPE